LLTLATNSELNLLPISELVLNKAKLLNCCLSIMGKNKVRVGGSKGARWARGQSSNSNPAKSKHRTQARSRFFNSGAAGVQLHPKGIIGLADA
jgi:hypothetical protein